MRARVLSSIVTLGYFVSLPSLGVAGNISGTVTSESRGGVSNIQVDFLDGLNAEQLASSTTGAYGTYNSGILPDGNYRVRFSDLSIPRRYKPEFFGAGGSDSFCDASLLSITSDSSMVVDEAMSVENPTPIVIAVFRIGGTVLDDTTSLPIQSIQVDFLAGKNAEPVHSTSTDADGNFHYSEDDSHHATIRVRFSDPSGIYYPEFSSDVAARSDDFCQGTQYSRDAKNVLIARLTPIPVQPDDLITIVEGLGLPGDVTTSLGTPLTRATDILTDDNPQNDTAVCKQLNAFISRVDIQEVKGQLSADEADTLRQATEAMNADLGCS